MKVYIVLKEPEYEGGGSYYGTTEIKAVFDSKENAEEYIKKLLPHERSDVEVEEYELK